MCDEDETSRDRTVGLEENGRTSKVLYQLCSETCATVSGRRVQPSWLRTSGRNRRGDCVEESMVRGGGSTEWSVRGVEMQ